MRCQQDLTDARADRSQIDAIRENFRTHLLTALSEARGSSVGMYGKTRDALMDGLQAQFHPDSPYMRDIFTEALTDAENVADERVDEVQPKAAE